MERVELVPQGYNRYLAAKRETFWSIFKYTFKEFLSLFEHLFNVTMTMVLYTTLSLLFIVLIPLWFVFTPLIAGYRLYRTKVNIKRYEEELKLLSGGYGGADEDS